LCLLRFLLHTNEPAAPPIWFLLSIPDIKQTRAHQSFWALFLRLYHNRAPHHVCLFFPGVVTKYRGHTNLWFPFFPCPIWQKIPFRCSLYSSNIPGHTQFRPFPSLRISIQTLGPQNCRLPFTFLRFPSKTLAQQHFVPSISVSPYSWHTFRSLFFSNFPISWPTRFSYPCHLRIVKTRAQHFRCFLLVSSNLGQAFSFLSFAYSSNPGQNNFRTLSFSVSSNLATHLGFFFSSYHQTWSNIFVPFFSYHQSWPHNSFLSSRIINPGQTFRSFLLVSSNLTRHFVPFLFVSSNLTIYFVLLFSYHQSWPHISFLSSRIIKPGHIFRSFLLVSSNLATHFVPYFSFRQTWPHISFLSSRIIISGQTFRSFFSYHQTWPHISFLSSRIIKSGLIIRSFLLVSSNLDDL